jgi:hypothetical protein
MLPDDGLFGRPAHGSLQQGRHFLLQDRMTGEPHRLQAAGLFEVVIERRTGKGRIGPNVEAHRSPCGAGDDRLQYLPPAMSAVHVPRP